MPRLHYFTLQSQRGKMPRLHNSHTHSHPHWRRGFQPRYISNRTATEQLQMEPSFQPRIIQPTYNHNAAGCRVSITRTPIRPPLETRLPAALYQRPNSDRAATNGAELPAAYNTANLQSQRGKMPRLHYSHPTIPTRQDAASPYLSHPFATHWRRGFQPRYISNRTTTEQLQMEPSFQPRIIQPTYNPNAARCRVSITRTPIRHPLETRLPAALYQQPNSDRTTTEQLQMETRLPAAYNTANLQSQRGKMPRLHYFTLQSQRGRMPRLHNSHTHSPPIGDAASSRV